MQSGETESNGCFVAQLADYLPHMVSKVICLKCYKRWIAVRPTHTLLESLECPNCGAGYVIETGQVLKNSDSYNEEEVTHYE